MSASAAGRQDGLEEPARSKNWSRTVLNCWSDHRRPRRRAGACWTPLFNQRLPLRAPVNIVPSPSTRTRRQRATSVLLHLGAWKSSPIAASGSGRPHARAAGGGPMPPGLRKTTTGQDRNKGMHYGKALSNGDDVTSSRAALRNHFAGLTGVQQGEIIQCMAITILPEMGVTLDKAGAVPSLRKSTTPGGIIVVVAISSAKESKAIGLRNSRNRMARFLSTTT